MAKSGQVKAEQEKRQRFRLKKLKWRKIKTWVLLVALVPLLFVDATLLRRDHIRMTELRDAVLAADESEDDAAVATALDELRTFTFSHIVINVVEENGRQQVTFGTGPFYLEHQYLRAANEALAAAEAELADDANPNGNIYQAAADVCVPDAIAHGWNWTTPEYVNCMVGELQKYPAAEELSDQIVANLPSTELFRVNYASPVWTPSGSGVALLVTAVIMIIILWRAVAWVVLRVAVLFC